MRNLIVAEHISLDGVIQGPGGPTEDPSDGFDLGGWITPYGDKAIGGALKELFSPPFELLLGRRTYDIWAAYWPNVQNNPTADKFNTGPKHVATHRPDTLGWHNSQALKGDVADAVRALKRQDGPNLMTWGSADLVRQLLANGLVDEFLLLLYPVVLGRGKRFFGYGAQPAAFSLAHSERTPGGAMINRYVRSGD
jgi:dihydrofolate reductase